MPKLQEPLPKSNSVSVDKIEEFKYESVLMKSHLDVVRGITYIEHNENSYIASASEDCTIKLWKTNLAENKEPLMVLRGHTGPIFCISSYHNLIFSAGCEGIIKIWDVSKLKQIEPYAMLKGETGCIGNFKKHTETIWDLRINPISSMLLTVSADGYIGMWNTSIIDSFNEEEYNSNLLKHMFSVSVYVGQRKDSNLRLMDSH
jgi:WD40 repeat protein